MGGKMCRQNHRLIVALAVLLCLAWSAGPAGFCWATTGSVSSNVAFAVPYYAPPKRAQLCGEAVPLNTPDVWERFDREFTIVVYSHAQVYLWLKRMERYFPWIEKQLALQNLPEDLKWVAVAESDLLYTSCSPAGAAGPWQFMPSTGRSYGLNQSSHLDERHDFEMSTQSAFKYLKDLHRKFQNWTLAIAAYNCGEGRIGQEIRNQKLRDYYALKLPLETERYVLRIAAIKEVLSHPEKYGYSFPDGAGYPQIPVDRVNVNLADALPIQPVAEAADMTFREFRILNPAFKSDVIPAGSHSLKVHKGKGKMLEQRLASIKPKYEPPKAPKQQVINHRVKKGETMTGIANRYKVSAGNIRTWNKLKNDNIKIGQVLKIIK
jgi:membrane-bound lytic murein transglycosylase D